MREMLFLRGDNHALAIINIIHTFDLGNRGKNLNSLSWTLLIGWSCFVARIWLVERFKYQWYVTTQDDFGFLAQICCLENSWNWQQLGYEFTQLWSGYLVRLQVKSLKDMDFKITVLLGLLAVVNCTVYFKETFEGEILYQIISFYLHDAIFYLKLVLLG